MSRMFPAGVATGQLVTDIFQYAKENGFALPAVNVIGSSNVNAVMETAAKLNAPVIVQYSNGGAIYNAGKGLNNDNQRAAVLGAAVVLSTSTLWRKLMALRLFYIPTTVLRNYCLGLMD